MDNLQENWVTVKRTFNLGEAQLLISILNAAGVSAHLTNDLSTLAIGPSLATGGFLIQVPEGRLEEAIKIINSKNEQEPSL